MIAAAPLLLFPRGTLPWVGLGLLIAGWLSRGVGTGKWLVRTPFDRPIAIVLLMALVGIYVSADLTLSMPKFFGILLGCFIFYATVNFVTTERRFYVALGLLPASIVAVAAIGLVGTEWLVGKYPLPPQFYRLFPRLIRQVQSSFGPAGGINPNELGSTLAFLLPVSLALLLRVKLSWLLRSALAIAVVLGLGVLALSASRSAALGLFVVLLLMLVWWWRRVGLAAVSIAAIVLGVVLNSGAVEVGDFLLRVDAISPATDSISVRLELWERARYMIEDFPFTGIGLNTFPIVLDSLYPTFLADPDLLIPHAHNMFLQTAIDLGLGGLLAFVGLAVLAGRAGLQAFRQAGACKRSHCPAKGRLSNPLAIQSGVGGLLLGLLSYLVFGLTDTVSLGAKPITLLWLMLGLVVAAQRLTGVPEEEGSIHLVTAPSRMALARRSVAYVAGVIGWMYWAIAFSLVALGYLVVGIAVSGWTP